MPRPDVLPPISRPMHAEILLGSAHSIDARLITEFLAERSIPLGDVPWTVTPRGVRRAIRGGEIRIEQRAAPIESSTLAGPLEDAGAWWDVSAVGTHTHVVKVTVASNEHSAASTGRILVRLTAAVIDSGERVQAPVVGVLWDGERLLPAGFVQLHATTEPALGVLVGFHVGKPGTGRVLHTTGLPALGLMNMEVPALDGELEAAAGVMQHWARRLITEGPAVMTEGTIGNSAEDRATVSVGPSSVGRETVYRLTFGEPPAAKQPPLETVVCPECNETVQAEVVRMGFIPILQRCPACGTGPVALLAEMLDNVGGGEIDVTFETTDAVALAKLLSEHDSRFDSIIDASDHLRDLYDGRRAVVRMSRLTAAMISAAAPLEYPGVRIVADEALGMMEPGRDGIFHAATADTAMTDAISAARASVGEFITRLEGPRTGDESFGVKVKFDDPVAEQVEHIWLSDVRREGNEFVGVLEAEPRLVRNVKLGQLIRVPVNHISDWGFTNGEAMHGNYTLRVMLGSLPKPMQTALRARLVPMDR